MNAARKNDPIANFDRSVFVCLEIQPWVEEHIPPEADHARAMHFRRAHHNNRRIERHREAGRKQGVASGRDPRLRRSSGVAR